MKLKGKILQQAFLALLEQKKMPIPVTEHKFLQDRKFMFDYAWPRYKLALEVEGGIWRKGGGAHSRPQAIIRDIEKYNLATIAGWRVLRVVPEKLTLPATLEMIEVSLIAGKFQSMVILKNK